MKHHQNPHEGIRIDLPVDEALRRALNTPAPSKAELEAFLKKEGAAKARAKTAKAKPKTRRRTA